MTELIELRIMVSPDFAISFPPSQMNITQVAQANLRDQLTRIAISYNSEALQKMLSGAGLPALSRDDEPAEQIHDALEFGSNYADLAQSIACLLASLIEQRTDALVEQLTSSKVASVSSGGALVCNSPYLEDEMYVFNLFLLASHLPRQQVLFGGLKRFHEIGFKRDIILSSTNNRVSFQLRRALAEQQHDSELRAYWLDLLQDRKRTWNPARRTELLEAWNGLLGTLDFDANKQDAINTLDIGLCALHDSVEPHPEGSDLLKLALLRLVDAYPMDPTTWINYLTPAWERWGERELLQDVTVSIWPALEPKSLDNIPSLPQEFASLWAAMSQSQQGTLCGFHQRNDTEAGRNYLINLQFELPSVSGQSQLEVRKLIIKLGNYLWPTDKKQLRIQPQNEDEAWDKTKAARPVRRVPLDRLARLEAINRALTKIESLMGEGKEDLAKHFLNDLVEEEDRSGLPDQHLHTAKTLAKAATIMLRFGNLEWAESLILKACEKNPNDKVSACGLADVLKALGELEAAETQYRQNRVRWPNDEVSACGLADVLKARGELEAAETQYRQNMVRWPNNRVAINGLANLLRKRTRYSEALALLPESSADCYALHLRAMILLLDIGRLRDARKDLKQGLMRAIGSKQKEIFLSSLALLELRAQKFERASKILADLPDNVIPLNLIRLHFEAAQNHANEAGSLATKLSAQRKK